MICTFCDIFVKNLKFPKAPKCLQSAAHLLCGHMCHLSAELLYSRGSKFTFVATEQKQRVTKCHTQTQKFALNPQKCIFDLLMPKNPFFSNLVLI